MKKTSVFFKGISDLSDLFLQTSKKFLLINCLIAVILPLLLVLNYRTDIPFSLFFLSTLIWGLYLVGIYQWKLIRKNKYVKMKTSMLTKRIFEYGILPYFLMYVKIIAILPLILLLNSKGVSNPQNLKELSQSDLFENILSCIQAGAEEIWRVSLIILTLYLFRVASVKLWNNTTWYRVFAMGVSCLFSSFVFGWAHTFAYSDGWINLNITLILGLAGIMYALFILITRNIWIVVLAHIAFDINSVTERTNGLDNVFMQFMLFQVIAMGLIIFLIEKKREKTLAIGQ